MSRGATTSISTRLAAMNVLVSGVALLLACMSFFAYDQITFRDGLVRTLSAQAQIISSNSVSAILFNDPQAATNTLSALSSSQNISSAGIFTPNGLLFAKYSRERVNPVLTLPVLPSGEAEVHTFGRQHLIMVRQIISQGKPIGVVYLRADLTE